MNENVVVEVSGIRLEEDSETPIMLLHDPDTSRFLPIWIGTIEAVSIAYAQEGYVHPRPQTHDLLIDIVESLNASITEVSITDIKDKTYYAEITLNTIEGNVTLSSRPSDAIALAIRSNSKITVNNDIFSQNSIILIDDNNQDIKEFAEFIDDISPDDFLSKSLNNCFNLVDWNYATGLHRPEVCKITGISYRQLDHWTSTGLINASIRNIKGSGFIDYILLMISS